MSSSFSFIVYRKRALGHKGVLSGAIDTVFGIIKLHTGKFETTFSKSFLVRRSICQRQMRYNK